MKNLKNDLNVWPRMSDYWITMTVQLFYVSKLLWRDATDIPTTIIVTAVIAIIRVR